MTRRIRANKLFDAASCLLDRPQHIILPIVQMHQHQPNPLAEFRALPLQRRCSADALRDVVRDDALETFADPDLVFVVH